MNFFGLVIGQHILLVLFALLFVAIGHALLGGGWISKVIGVFLFAGAAGWLASIILYDNARIPGLGLPAAVLISLLAACYAAVTLYKQKDVPKRNLLGNRNLSVNRNAIIAGTLVVVMVLITLSFLSGGNWENFFQFDNRAANRAYEETTNGLLRSINRLLRNVDQLLAK